MPKIFISYRRADSTAQTGRIYDRLVQAFGADSVFKDVNDILGGHDFRRVLEQEVANCDVLLVIIGRQWASIASAEGQPRLADPDDFVRIEVESGLKREDVLVIPLLVDNATFPTPMELPETLHNLAYRNAMFARNDPDFDVDMDRLIHRLRTHFKTLRKEQPPRRNRRIMGVMTVVAVILIVIVLVLTFNNGGGESGKPTDSAEIASLTPTPFLTDTHSPTATPGDFGPITLDGVRVYSAPRQSASLIAPSMRGTFTITGYSEDETWIQIALSENRTGWLQKSAVITPTPTPAPPIIRVFFSRPENETDFLNYASEIETFLTQTINETRSTLDIAAFEFDNPILTNAIINAYWRGVQIRIVTDNEHGLEDLETSMADFIEAGIGVVDDGRTAFMHNSFMILDGRAVWAGDSSFTVNSATRNNTSAIYIESEELAQLYTTEFEEMYLDQLFGPNSPENTQGLVFAGEIPLQVFFAPEDNVLDIISATLDTADRNLEFMMFSFTNDAVGQLMLSLAETRGIQVRGIVERTGSMNGELPDLVCSGLDVRTDGNPRFMNHKIILIDDETVLAMSSNLSTNAMTSNDENIMIFTSPEIVAQYRQEFETLWAIAELPQGVDCSALQN